MNTFEDFANSTLKASEILKQDAIDALIAANDVQALWKYAYRIAGFVVIYVQKRAPIQLDETDYQDAVQDCMLVFPDMLEKYTADRGPFLRYISTLFQYRIREYLWSWANGGTGSQKTGAVPVRVVEWLDERTDHEGEHLNEIERMESTGFGTRNPETEAASLDVAKYCVAYARKVGKHAKGPWDEPELLPKRKHNMRGRHKKSTKRRHIQAA